MDPFAFLFCYLCSSLFTLKYDNHLSFGSQYLCYAFLFALMVSLTFLGDIEKALFASQLPFLYRTDLPSLLTKGVFTLPLSTSFFRLLTVHLSSTACSLSSVRSSPRYSLILLSSCNPFCTTTTRTNINLNQIRVTDI